MKKLCVIFLLTLLPMVASTQIKRTINIETAGTLPNLIQNDEKYEIEELTLTGELNGTDIRFIRQMSGVDYRFDDDDYYSISTPGKLKNLDISNAKIVSGGEDYYRRSTSQYEYVFYSTKDNSISAYMFYECKLTSIKVPNSVTSIGSRAFYECSGLTSIEIPNSVTSIGADAFKGTAWFNNQTDGIVYAGKFAYKYKGEMPVNTAIELKKGTLGVANKAFSSCSNLTAITIPNSVTNIGEGAFSGCNNLTSVTIPNSVTNIGEEAFNGTAWDNNLPNGMVYVGKVAYKYKGAMPTNTSITLMDGTLGVAGGAFRDCSGLTSVTIPEGVTSIEGSAFRYCGSLTSVTIPDGVTRIGDYAFSGCGSLTSITIPNSVTSIGISAFSYCDGLTSVTIPNSVTSIGNYAFSGCSGLTSVTIPNSVMSIGRWAFNSCTGLTSLTISKSVTNIGDWAFQGCTGLTSITIPDGVTSIEEVAFSGCTGLTSVTIPNSVTSIGNCAFDCCSGLTSVTIPNSVTSIGNYAFSGCSGLTSVTIPNSVTSIGSYAFRGCNGLKFICLASDKYPSSSLGNTSCQYIMPQSAFDAGIPQDITNYATYTVAPKYITVKSTTATTATLELTPIDLPGGSTGGTPYEVTMYDLKPGSSVKGSWKDGASDQGLASIPTVTTKNLVMNVQPAKLLSKEKAGLLATVDEPDDDKHYGFEWQRNDAPSNMTPYQVNAQLYEGKIIGTLSGLDPDKYYKYRPFYKADDGTLFRGEWEAFITGDATVTFEPDVHTRESVVLPDGNIVLTLVLADGTEMTLEKGFELRIIVRQTAATRSDWSAEDENITRVVISGDGTSATVEGLEPGTEYAYRAYVKTESGTIYGEEKTFKTPLPGDANDNGAVDAADIVELVNAKAGHPSASFNLNNADANADGSFTEADITATADIIMKR